MTGGHFTRRHDSSGSSSSYIEVMLEGGGAHCVPVSVEKQGTVMVWEFQTEPKGIAFGISYKKLKDGGEEEEKESEVCVCVCVCVCVQYIIHVCLTMM